MSQSYHICYLPRDLCLFGWGDRSLGMGDPGGGTKGGIPMSTPFPTPLSRHKCDSAVFFFFSLLVALHAAALNLPPLR